MLKTNTRIRGASKILAVIFLSVSSLLVITGMLSAQTLNRGYKADQTLQKGMLVKEKDGDPTKVEPLTRETLDSLKGVVVARNDSPVVIASEDQTVFVASTGVYEVLVSDENGMIEPGDYLSISSLSGIAMKATREQSLVLGRAAAAFSGQGDAIGSTARESDNKQINFGRIETDIAIAANPLQKNSRLDTVPKILREVSSSVAGQPVSNARIWLASIVFIATSLLTGIMLYGGTKSSLLALGRNPLSKASIIRGLLQVVILGLTVFICGMFGVYLLLKL
ncbi:MAG TPA: hypothetical protein VFX86_00400 [Candidatus Saccharimonadales bacterium]|nr:hypothetical protein [Candidatus Saccharimonadales bacterium]